MKLTLMYYVLLLLMFPVSENNVRLLQEIKKSNVLKHRMFEQNRKKNPLTFCTKNDNFKVIFVSDLKFNQKTVL